MESAPSSAAAAVFSPAQFALALRRLKICCRLLAPPCGGKRLSAVRLRKGGGKTTAFVLIFDCTRLEKRLRSF